MNTCNLIGRLGADPELRYTKSGSSVCNFRLAVDGPKDRTDWLSIVAWGATAEGCAQYLQTGSLVGVTGRVQSRSWETQDGQKRTSVEVSAYNVQFLDKPGDADTSEPAEDEFGDIPPEEDIFSDE